MAYSKEGSQGGGAGRGVEGVTHQTLAGVGVAVAGTAVTLTGHTDAEVSARPLAVVAGSTALARRARVAGGTLALLNIEGEGAVPSR